jgi:hypothetical protein
VGGGGLRERERWGGSGTRYTSSSQLLSANADPPETVHLASQMKNPIVMNSGDRSAARMPSAVGENIAPSFGAGSVAFRANFEDKHNLVVVRTYDTLSTTNIVLVVILVEGFLAVTRFFSLGLIKK